jgi:hypothetical protein
MNGNRFRAKREREREISVIIVCIFGLFGMEKKREEGGRTRKNLLKKRRQPPRENENFGPHTLEGLFTAVATYVCEW